jgi:hypothetical protein
MRLGLPKPAPTLADLVADYLEEQDREARQRPVGRQSTTIATPGQGAAPGVARNSRQSLNAHPLAVAAAVAISIALFAGATDFLTRDALVVRKIDRAYAPRLTGDLSDPIWTMSRPVTVLTQQGANFAGTGESLVEVRAVHDGKFAYFAFTWTDPTRSLKHLPLVKEPDGWHLSQTNYDVADENWFHEDKFSVLLAKSGRPLIGAAVHLGRAPLAGRPGSMQGRGLHYTQDGSVLEFWLWRASHGGLIGRIDHGHIGAPVEPTQDQAEGLRRYAGGYALDPGTPIDEDNFDQQPPGGYLAPLKPRRLPKEPAAMMRAMGRIDFEGSYSEAEGSRWWMTSEESVPYSEAEDERIPIGTVIPGVILADQPSDDGTQFRCAARWSAGRWTLEVRRRLDTGNPNDVVLSSGVLMWVAAFDHSQTHHTRHLRPIRLEIE